MSVAFADHSPGTSKRPHTAFKMRGGNLGGVIVQTATAQFAVHFFQNARKACGGKMQNAVEPCAN
ncbi:MAG TPA: hypothetical protein DEB47_22635 [Citreicella sp.]|nr:hypothetical protein [Citreicella sp.]